MMQQRNIFNYLTYALPPVIIACCFLPWVHYNSIDVTFNGFNVKQFATGVNYGRAGLLITAFCIIISMLGFLRTKTAGHIALFISAALFAYTVRTYVLFTGSLFAGEVVKYPGIYLITWLPLLLLVSFIARRR